MMACGLDYSTANMSETEFYVSHECLLLDYESALTRQDSTTGLWFAHRVCMYSRQHCANCNTPLPSLLIMCAERLLQHPFCGLLSHRNVNDAVCLPRKGLKSAVSNFVPR